jgi:uncharacterized protein YndB with AHSA1/START domain
VLPVSPDIVYREWVDADALKDWMCPQPARATRVELDPRPGGRLRIDIEEEGVAFSVTGIYLDLDPPRRLSFTWSCTTWPNPAVDSVVTVTLEPHGDGATYMTIRHALPSELRPDHQRGWAAIADQLDRKLRALT